MMRKFQAFRRTSCSQAAVMITSSVSLGWSCLDEQQTRMSNDAVPFEAAKECN